MTSYGVACGHWTHRKAEAASGFLLPDSFSRCGNYEPVLTVMPGRIIWIKMSTLPIICTLTIRRNAAQNWPRFRPTRQFLHPPLYLVPCFQNVLSFIPDKSENKIKKKKERGAVLRPVQVNSPFLFSKKKKTYKKPASRLFSFCFKMRNKSTKYKFYHPVFKETKNKPTFRLAYSLFVLEWGINPRSINFIILSSKRPKIKDPRTSTFLESKGSTCIHGTGC